MATWKKWAVGIGLILSAISAWVVATFDSDANTNVTISETVDGVKDGINVINFGDRIEVTTDAAGSSDDAKELTIHFAIVLE